MLIRWIAHTHYGGAFSVLVPRGPRTWDPKCEESVFHMNYPPEFEEMFDTDDKVVALIRERIGLAEFDPTVHL